VNQSLACGIETDRIASRAYPVIHIIHVVRITMFEVTVAMV